MTGRQFAAVGLVVGLALVGVIGAVTLLPADGGAEADPGDVPRFVQGGKGLAIESAEGQTVRGVTDLPNGSEVTVRLRGSGENPFLMTRTTAVDADGEFEVAFDTSDVPPGSTFEATLRHDGEVVTETAGTVE